MLLLISSFVIIFNSDNTDSCSFDISADDYYSVFDPKLINQPSLIPFFLSELHFFPDEDSSLYNEKLQNILDWKKYFNEKPEIKDIEKLIYPTDKTDLLEIAWYMKKNDYSLLKEKWRYNSLVNHLRETKNINAIEYLVYAKMCEPHVGEYDNWKNPRRDTTGMAGLIESGIKNYHSVNDNFLKLRYAFQFIRLAHYSENYTQAVELYAKFVLPLNDTTIINYWTLSLKAGALKHLNREYESNYYYSIVFDRCITRRYIAAKDFRVRSDSSFNRSLELCKNDTEKAAFWMLTAFKNNSLHLEAMKQIYLLNPKSPYLDLLLARELNRVEREIFPNTYGFNVNHRNYNTQNFWANLNNRDLLNLVRNYAENRKTLRPELWYLAAGYLCTLAGKPGDATGSYANAKSSWYKNDINGLEKIKLFEEMNYVLLFYELDAGTEKRIMPHLKWLYEQSKQSSEKYKYIGEFYVPGRNDALSALLYVRSRLAQVYASNGDFIKMHLLLGDERFGYDLTDNPKNQPVDNLIAFFDKPKKTDFEKLLERMYVYYKSDLLEIKGTILLSRHKFKEAIIAFNEAGSFWKLRADPFTYRIKDCLSCDAWDKSKTKYTKLSFSHRMLELDSLAYAEKENAYKYYFLMANGFYNITYFGNSWNASSYHRDYDYNQMYNEQKDWEFYDCSIAQKYYEKAMQLTSDREFAAMCIFMMSKCEQNDFYNNLYQFRFKDDKEYFEKKLEYRNNFRKLRGEYSDTEYYKQILNECKYFDIFVNSYKQ